MGMQPTSGIVGGPALRIPAIQSPNFSIAGQVGWGLFQNGLAYFFDGVRAGGFTGNDFIIDSSGAFFYNGAPAYGNLILAIAAAAGVDAFGNAYAAGLSNAPGTNMGTPAATAAAGTTAANGTEVRDAVLGSYVFTALAGHRYEAKMNGLGINGQTPQLAYARIRNGGAATPTIASVIVAETHVFIPATGGPGQATYPLAGTFLPAAGLVTLGMFTTAGPGGAYPIFPRELYAVDLGLA